MNLENENGRRITLEQMPAWRALRGETVRDLTMVVNRGQQDRRWLTASAAPIRLAGTDALHGAVVTFKDVTATRELEQRREDTISIISHDLRAPVTIVQGQAQAIKRAPDRPDGVAKSAEAIARSAQQMNGMIQDLVDSARLESGHLELSRRPIDLRQLLLGLKEQLGWVLPTERVQVRAARHLPLVYADAARVERILTNLISNALRYSAEGTPVLVRLSRREDSVVVAVSDHGVGIAAEELPRRVDRAILLADVRPRISGAREVHDASDPRIDGRTSHN